MSDIWEKLKNPFQPEQIEWRVGSTSKSKLHAQLLAYVTARAVMERLDEVVGPQNWEVKHTPVQLEVDPGKDPKDLGRRPGFLTELRVRVDEEWISKMDVSDCTDIESLKGAASGGLKRAAVMFGVGRYLYDIDGSRFYEILEGYPPNGSNAIYCPRGDERKPGHLRVPKLPEWALPKLIATPVAKAEVAEPPPPDPAASRGKETEEEKVNRQAGHDESFTAQERRRFMGRIKEIGLDYTTVCAMQAWRKKPRPSEMDQVTRNAFEKWLGTDGPKGGVQALEDFLAPREVA